MRKPQDAAKHEAARFAALSRVGIALAAQLDEAALLDLIAHTALDLTHARFAAFTLRPLDSLGQPVVPAEGSSFHLAAVVGVTPEEEAVFRRIPLGGEGILAPIFRHGKSVRVSDVLALAHNDEDRHDGPGESKRDAARRSAAQYADGHISADQLRAVGTPRGHPVVRSFLGAPLVNHTGEVRGGLLLGHHEPNRFTADDETLLLGLAAQASVALEKTRLYRAAQAQAQELDAIFESITDGVILVDATGNIRRENRAATLLRQAITASAANTTAFDDLIRAAALHAADQGRYEATHVLPEEQVSEAREYVVTAAALRDSPLATLPPTDTRVPEPLTGRTSAGAVVIWHDVTETQRLLAEHQAHAEAERRRALLQLIIDQLPSGIYVVRGPDARLVLANSAAMDVWGASWTLDQPMIEFLGGSGTQIFSADGRQLDASALATLRVLRTGEAIRHHQEVIRRPDGTALPILFNAVALDPLLLENVIAGGSSTPHAQDIPPRAALIVLQDVTALKDTERLKDEFLAIAAHELKTPMAAVKGYAGMLRQRNPQASEPGALADWQLEALDTIDQATTRLVELTDDLLDVARLQSGRIGLHFEPHDMLALTRRVAHRVQVTTDQHTITTSSDFEYVVAQLDVRRIEQVLTNLLNNAIKYSPQGGPITVMVREDADAGYATVSVTDTGIGIPNEQQARLFGRFERADNARELGIKGTGLGLYLCRELVELHHGRIWFESTLNAGSIFSFTLPLATE